MTKKQAQAYSSPGALQDVLKTNLVGNRYQLDCGHHVSVGHQFSNGFIIRGNGINQPLTLICIDCGT